MTNHAEAPLTRAGKPIPKRLRAAIWIAKLFLLITGLGSSAAGLFAYQLGLDNDPGWGRGRVILFVTGVVLILGAVWIWSCEAAPERSPAAFLRSPHARRIITSPMTNATESGWLYSMSGAAFTILLSAWYLTSGTLITWTPYTLYFDMQANAFRAGQVALLEEPSAELKAMDNPYDWRARTNAAHIWDVSYFQEKYYLYWGPVPALLAAAAKMFAPVTLEDQYLLFFFVSGLAITGSLILSHLRQALFPKAPLWTLLPLTMLAALATPVFWLVNRPSVYETAIAGGQFFLILGLFCALHVLTTGRAPKGWLLGAGLAWGAAIGCRLNLALAIGFFFLVLGISLLRKLGWRPALAQLLWSALPVVVAIVGLGWFNYARFGNPFETGHRYQLTGPALPQDYRNVTSLSYAPPSLYSYLFRPLELNSYDFPFVFAPYIQENMWPSFLRLPEHYYYSEPVAGLLASTPAIWLTLLPALGGVCRLWFWLWEEPLEPPETAHPAERTIWLSISGGAACLLAPLLIFISTSMRYLADVTPMTVLLAAMGLWWGLRLLYHRPALRNALTIAATALILISLAFSLLVNFRNGDKRFETNNPALYYAIAEFLTRDR